LRGWLEGFFCGSGWWRGKGLFCCADLGGEFGGVVDAIDDFLQGKAKEGVDDSVEVRFGDGGAWKVFNAPAEFAGEDFASDDGGEGGEVFVAHWEVEVA